MSLRLGIVVDNNDPDNLRRVKVQSQDRGSSISDWLSRITTFSNQDLPVPDIGETVIIGSIDNDTHSDIVLGSLTSLTSNKPLDKDSGRDNYSELDGKTEVISEQITLVTREATLTVRENGGIKLENKLGSIYLLPTGHTIISYPGGEIKLGSSGSLNITSSQPINITSPNLTYNGNQVAVVGGLDSHGDTTIS